MQTKLPYLLPAVIVLAGLIVAVAIYTVRTGSETYTSLKNIGSLLPISTDDHILGNPEAPVHIITYSDIDCEYCKTFRESMEQLVSDESERGAVAWVYRHYPQVAQHLYASKHALAAECAYLLGKDTAFFGFIRSVNQIAPGSGQFDPAGYSVIADTLSLPKKDFLSCIEGEKTAVRVERDVRNALDIGADALPYSVLLVDGKAPVPISGALSYQELKAVVDKAQEN